MRVLKMLGAFVIVILGLVFGTGGGCIVGYGMFALGRESAAGFVVSLWMALGIAGAIAGVIGGIRLARRLLRTDDP